MAHRAPDAGWCLKPILVALATIAGLLALCGATLAECDERAPAQRPTIPREVDPVPSWQPARAGDQCSPAGAVRHSSTGATLTCGRYRGLGYDTWG